MVSVSDMKNMLIEDYGESNYVSRITGALPAGSQAWTDFYDHQPWADLLPYFINAYKTGTSLASQTTPDKLLNGEVVVLWYRTHSKTAVASGDSLAQPSGASYADDNVQVIAILSSPSWVAIKSGTKQQWYWATSGFNYFSLSGFTPGTQNVIVMRSNELVMCGVGKPINNTITAYNFNSFVVKAAYGGCPYY